MCMDLFPGNHRDLTKVTVGTCKKRDATEAGPFTPNECREAYTGVGVVVKLISHISLSLPPFKTTVRYVFPWHNYV